MASGLVRAAGSERFSREGTAIAITADIPDAIGSLLDRCALFHVLDDATKRQLAARAQRRRYAVGEVIFRIGSPGDIMMAVVTGTVRIVATSPQGKEIVLGELKAGEVFGEIALLDGGERSAYAVALTKCELLALERRDLMAALQRNPEACLRLLEVVCKRLRETDERITEIAFFELPVRLAKVLLRTAAAPGAAARAANPKVALSQRELGNMIGGTRESVNRCLRDWQRRGIIRLAKGWIILEDTTALTELAGLR
jgi:CRP/FNR family transcriptional regulator, cyclic AMP receptor protein